MGGEVWALETSFKSLRITYTSFPSIFRKWEACGGGIFIKIKECLAKELLHHSVQEQ